MQAAPDPSVRILALAGSYRKGSLNQALIRSAREEAPDHVRIDDFDLRTLPFYDGDLEAAGDPEEVGRFKDAVSDADGLLVATPEYNRSIPAVLKNGLDWASRDYPDSPLSGKPVAIVGATPGRGGTNRAQTHLREILDGIGAIVLSEPALCLARANEHIHDGHVTDEAVRETLRGIATKLAEFAEFRSTYDLRAAMPTS